MNAAHEQTFGSKIGDSLLVHVHPDDFESTNRAMDGLARPPHLCTLEQRCEVKGTWRTFRWQVGVIRDRTGNVVEFQGVGFDITDLKRAEELLRESERKSRESAAQAREDTARWRATAPSRPGPLPNANGARPKKRGRSRNSTTGSHWRSITACGTTWRD